MSQAETKIIRLYVAEEQEIYREVYKSIFPPGGPVELLQDSNNGNTGILPHVITELNADVVLLSTKRLEANVLEGLEQIRTDYPEIGIVLLLTFCNTQDTELLRRLALKGEGGIHYSKGDFWASYITRV